jgi:hypothetical protein
MTNHERVSSIADLPRDIAPPRDLWPAIESAIAAPAAKPARRYFRAPQLLAMAAAVAALAIGVWIGRSTLPGQPVAEPLTAANGTGTTPAIMQTAFVTDPKYLRERAALVRSLESRLAALPPETQKKVAVSLQTIRASMADLEAALGKDPSNALLQELLVNTYQEEMRVLAVVHEAGASRQET